METLDALAWVIIGSVLSTDSSQIDESIGAYENAHQICTEIDRTYNQREMYDMALKVNTNNTNALYFKSIELGFLGTNSEADENHKKALVYLRNLE
ncbi:MAG: hypothetical protein ACT6FF_01215 [Methanosarcinaceae archaeon]